MEVKYLQAFLDDKIDLTDLVKGQLLKEKRKSAGKDKKGMTLGQLSDVSGVSTAQISAIENIGRRAYNKNSTKTIKGLTLRKLLQGMGEDEEAFASEVNDIVRETLASVKKKPTGTPEIDMDALLESVKYEEEDSMDVKKTKYQMLQNVCKALLPRTVYELLLREYAALSDTEARKAVYDAEIHDLKVPENGGANGKAAEA